MMLNKLLNLTQQEKTVSILFPSGGGFQTRAVRSDTGPEGCPGSKLP